MSSISVVLMAQAAVESPRPAPAPGEYELLWRVSRERFHDASRLVGKERVPLLEAGIEAGERAAALRPDRVEGHYWLGACVGRLAEAKGGLKALRSTGRLRREMEAVLRIAPDYENGDAYQALGRLDRELPGLFGGDKQRGLRYLQEGVRRAPGNMELRLALAQALVDEGRGAEARPQLDEILANGRGETRESARRLLARLH